MPNAVSTKRLVIGVDVGGTKVAAGFVDFSLIRCRKQEIPGDFDQFSLAVLTARLGFRSPVEVTLQRGSPSSKQTNGLGSGLPLEAGQRRITFTNSANRKNILTMNVNQTIPQRKARNATVFYCPKRREEVL